MTIHLIPFDANAPTRWHIFLWGVTMVTLLALCLYDWHSYQVGTYGDDGSYVTNTDSLLQGVPYGTLLTPNENRATQFPFLLPLLLTPLRALFPASLDVLRVLPLVTTLLAVTVLFWGWRSIGQGLSYDWGVAVLALTALSPVTILHARTIMSEAPFLLFALAMIVWVERILRDPPRAWGIVFGILTVCVLYTRTIGWLFVACWLIYLFWKGGRKLVPQFGLAAATIAMLLGSVLVLTSVRATDLLPQEYITDLFGTRSAMNTVLTMGSIVVSTDEKLIDTPIRLGSGAQRVWTETLLHLDVAEKLPFQMERALTEWTDRAGVPFLRYLPSVFMLLVVMVGAVAWWRATGLTAFQIIVPPYLLLLVAWVWNGTRLAYPIQPQLLLAFLMGVFVVTRVIVARVTSDASAARLSGYVTGTVTVLLLVSSVLLDVLFQRAMLLPGDQYARAAQLEHYLPRATIVLSTRATTDHLYVARTFIDIPTRLNSTQTLNDYLQRQQIEYVVTHYGVKPIGDQKNLRIGSVKRFVVALEPLIQIGALELKFLDAPNDLAVYRVDQDALKSFVP